MSFKSFSQKDTEIVLTEGVARLVVKDLVTFDGLSAEYKLTRQRIIVLEDKILTLQEVINNIQAQLDNRESVIQQKSFQIENYEQMTKDLQKALKRERTSKKLYKIGTAIAAGLLLNNMIAK